jgi:assimilatory nitrate reductase catalytic subunit
LVAAITDPVSGQPASKATIVTAKPFAVAWYGFLATKAAIAPQFDYCTIARSATGWTAELADRSAPQDWSAFLGKLIGQTEAEISSYTDPSSGQARLCVTKNGCIEALLFVGQNPIALARRTVAHAIGSSQSALAVLAGRPAADTPDEGAILCSCFSIGVNTIQRAINAGATTVTEIGDRTCAGTNCGSCRPELAAILAAQIPKIAAE